MPPAAGRWIPRTPVDQPTTLDDEQWAAIVAILERLDRARRDLDWEQSVGATKDLCEAVAKIILEARGEVPTAAADFPKLINGAHVALARQPGVDLADDPPVKAMAQAAKNAVLAVNDLRRTHGTGHGRARTADVLLEHAEIAADSAILWIRWGLRRLDVIVEGRSVDLVRDLHRRTFYREELARRLVAANIPDLDETEQRRLGIAVGQRAASGTFNVRIEGMEAAADDGPWTTAYRTGLIEGGLIDADGFLHSGPLAAQAVVALIDALGDDASPVLPEIVELLADAPVSYAMTAESRTEVAMLLATEAARFPEPVADAMRWLAGRFTPLPDDALDP